MKYVKKDTQVHFVNFLQFPMIHYELCQCEMTDDCLQIPKHNKYVCLEIKFMIT